MLEALPARIGRFQVRNEIGRGGFGRVYCAFDPTVGRLVAIKVLSEAGKDILSRFRNEAIVAGNLRHESIVTVYEFGEHEGNPFLVMEYLEGEDLHQIINSRKPLTLLQKCNIMSQVGEGLYCAHRNGVIHRDVKPANIMVLADGTVKIMDFGIARLTANRDATRLTQQGSVIGTLLYMAPEQFAGAEIDALSDIFAYGVLFYEFLTGKHPFEGADARTLMYKISFEDPPPLRDSVPDCPDALQQVISRLLQKDRELRYQSFKEVQLDCEPIRLEFQQQRAAKLLTQAQEQFAKKQLESAQSLLLEVLDLDPSNRLARTLRENVQKQLQLRTLQPRIEALLKSGEEHLAHRRFSDAVQSFDGALRLDRTNVYIQSRHEHARDLLEHSKRAAALLEQARLEFERENLTSAHKIVSEALGHDPQNTEVTKEQATIERAIEHRQRERAADEAIGKAERLVLRNAWDDAIAVLTAVGDVSEFVKVQRLLEWIQTEKRAWEKSQRLKSEMTVATGLFRSRNYAEAAGHLDKLLAEFPDNDEVRQLYFSNKKELEAQAKADELTRIASEVNAVTGAGKFDAAVAVLDEALKAWPGEAALIRLLGDTLAAKADWERQQGIQATLAHCDELRSEGRFAEAFQAAEAAIRQYGSEPELAELLRQIEIEWERQRREEAIERASSQVELLLGNTRPEKAVQLVQQVLREYPGESRLTELLARAQEQARALERVRAIEAILGRVSGHVDAQEFGPALEVLSRGLEAWPGEQLLLARQQATETAGREWERKKSIQEALVRGRQLGSRKQYGDALKLVGSSLQQFPGEPALLELEAALQYEFAEERKRKEVERGAKEARALINANRFEDALQFLRPIMQAYPGEQELESVVALAEERIREREKAAAIEQIIGETRRLTAERKFDRALERIGQSLDAWPAEAPLVRQQEAIKKAKAEWEREQAIAEIVRRVDQLASERRFSEASQILARSLQEYQESPPLVESRRRLEIRWEEHRREEDIAKIAADASAMAGEGQLKRACELLRLSLLRYPRESRLEDLLVGTEEALRQQERAEAIAEAAHSAEGLAKQRNYAAALDVLNRALSSWPDETRLSVLRDSVQTDKTAWEYEQAVGEVVRECENLGRQGLFEDALHAIDESPQKFRNDKTLQDVRTRLSGEWERQKRIAAIAEAASRIRAFLEQERLEDARTLARESMVRYAGEAIFESLAEQAEHELEARERKMEAARLGEEFTEAGRFDEAVGTLEPFVAQYPNDATLRGLLGRAQELLGARRHSEAMGKMAGEARQLASGGNFDGALALLARELESRPRENILLDLQKSIRSEKADWQREQALLASIRAITALLRDARFTEAVAAVETALRDRPDSPELLNLRQQSRRGKGVQDAGRMLGQGQPADALLLLEKLSPEFPDDEDIDKLLTRCRQEIEARVRAAAIDDLGRAARAKSSAEDFAGALELLDEGLRRWTDEPALIELRRAVLAERQDWKRRQAIRKGIDRCERLQREGQLDEALDLVSRLKGEFQGETALLPIEQRIKTAFEERERKRMRSSHMEELLLLEKAAPEAPDLSEAARMLERAKSVTAGYPSDEEVLSAGAGAIRHLSDIAGCAQELARDRFAAALAIARSYLGEYPDHLLFLHLAEEAERGQRAADLEELRQAAVREPNLETRARMLEEALNRFPDEAWVRDELGLTQNKLSLVASIVDKARALEAAHNWDKALAEWKSLLSVYRAYAGLDDAIARVEQARGQARKEAVGRFLKQIDRHIEAGDVNKAAEAIRQALSEFPEEPELQTAARRLEEIRAARKEARALLAQAKALSDQGRYEEIKLRLRGAFELDRDPAFRKLVLSSLVAYAREALEKGDFNQAERLLQEAASLDRNFVAPADLPTAIAAAKRAEMVRACEERAIELRSRGEPGRALSEVERLLETCPGEPRLIKFRQQMREATESLTRELRQLNEEIREAGEASLLKPLRLRAAAIAEENRDDPAISLLCSDAIRSADLRSKQLKWAPLLAQLRSPRNWIVGIAASVIAAGGFYLVPLLNHPSREVALQITSAPGASVAAGGKNCVTPCALTLAPGNYTLKANKEGYEAVERPLTVLPSQREVNLPLTLAALPAALYINSNFESGSVRLDGRNAGDLRDGQFTSAALAPGRHTVRVTGGGAEFEAEWQVDPGAAPRLVRQIAAKDVQATTVVNAGGTGDIACNCGAQDIAIDGAPAGKTGAAPEAPAPFRNLTTGTHQIAIAGRTMVFDVRPNPALTVFLALDRAVGILVVETGQDNARVYMNNQIHRRPTEHGLVRVVVPVGDYSIRVEKEGYRQTQMQKVTVQKGEEKRILLTLTAVPPVLEIANALAGAQVRVDGRVVGDIDQSGSLRAEVTPGEHAIQINKDGFTPARFNAQFNPGGTTRPDRGQLVMTAIARAPDPRQLELQDWERIANTENVDQLDDFIRKHPGGAHVEEARNRATQIRQQAQVNAVRLAEQTAWNALDKTRKSAVQEFLARYGNGAHAQDARALIAGMEKEEAEADSAAAARLREAKERESKEKEAADRAASDEQSINRTLSAFEAAYNRKDLAGLASIWSSLPRELYRTQFGDARALTFQLRPTGKPAVSGDTATVDCTRTLSITTSGQRVPAATERVRVTLSRAPSGWLIQNITTR